MGNNVYSADGHSSMTKERLEILGRGHFAVVDDFRSWMLNEVATKLFAQSMAHESEVVAFHAALRGHQKMPHFVDSMRTTLRLASAFGDLEA